MMSMILKYHTDQETHGQTWLTGAINPVLRLAWAVYL
ncbi:hypothetical protein SKA53_13596 [Yoonia vestfoldensis SKA53]|uniref:Uncharacterized protein n=1 Tax=Yoonia vestfoldensis SKA53 TaxID=314232 RepID=A3V4L7_9RHOB|nr:hypothetical protein SKA53_13596 [Yoonia vestfoldensis SKA53]